MSSRKTMADEQPSTSVSICGKAGDGDFCLLRVLNQRVGSCFVGGGSISDGGGVTREHL